MESFEKFRSGKDNHGRASLLKMEIRFGKSVSDIVDYLHKTDLETWQEAARQERAKVVEIIDNCGDIYHTNHLMFLSLLKDRIESDE